MMHAALIPAPAAPPGYAYHVVPAGGATDDDRRVVRMWLRNAAATHTRIAYRTDYIRWRMFCRTPLRLVSLEQPQAFVPVNLKEPARPLSKASQCRAISSVKALFRFAHRTRTSGHRRRIAQGAARDAEEGSSIKECHCTN